MEEKEKISKAIALCKQLGLKIVKKTKKPVEYEYDNGVCYLQVSSKELSTSDFILHNLAHFMLASPERRFLPDFGLGPSPGTPNKGLNPILGFHDSNMEENLCVHLSDYLASFLFKDPLPENLVNKEKKDNQLRLLGFLVMGKLQIGLRSQSDSDFQNLI